MLYRARVEVDRPADPMRSWVWSQHWLDVLFLHWQVPLADLQSHVPAPLEIATRDGSAWVSLVLFRLHVRPRFLPFVPGLSTLVEVNLRTYVRFQDVPGIWFLSVLADNRCAIRLAKLLTPMPYVRAAMRYRRLGGQFQFQARQPTASRFGLALTFFTKQAPAESRENSLDAWLLERYRLFARGSRCALMQAEVAHPRWVTQSVELDVSANRIGAPLQLDLSRAPDGSHYSAGVRARFGAFRVLAGVGMT